MAYSRKFRRDLALARHDMSAQTFKAALYNVELGAGTEFYTTAGEVVAAGYVAGGNSVTVSFTDELDRTVVNLGDLVVSNTTMSAVTVMVYNTTNQRTVATLPLGPIAINNGMLRIKFPVPFFVLRN